MTETQKPDDSPKRDSSAGNVVQPSAPSRTTIDARKLLSPSSAKEEHALRKDSLITKLAVTIVGGTACLSVAAIAWSEFLMPGSVSRDHWAIDLLTLTLVSSISFVMGAKSSNNSQD